MGYVFLSYARVDKRHMQALQFGLLYNNIAVWVDKHELSAGEAWGTELQKALMEAACIVLVATEGSVLSDWVDKELAVAQDKKTPIIPVWCSGEDSIPLRVRNLQYIDARQDYSVAIEQLVKHISQISGIRKPEPSVLEKEIDKLTSEYEALGSGLSDPELARKEMILLNRRAHAETLHSGYSNDKVIRDYEQVRRIYDNFSTTTVDGLFPPYWEAVWGSWAYYLVTANLPAATETAERLVLEAKGKQETNLLLDSYQALGSTLLRRGDPSRALTYFELALNSFYKPAEYRRSVPSEVLQDPVVTCMGDMAWALWLLGRPDKARDMSGKAFFLAAELGHEFTLAFAQFVAAVIYQMRREPVPLQFWAERAIESGFPPWNLAAKVFLGWAKIKQGHGDKDEIIQSMKDGKEVWLRSGARVSTPNTLAMIAEAHLEVGDIDESQQRIDEALDIIKDKQIDERLYEAELHRIQGEIYCKSSPPDVSKARKSFERAIVVSKDKGMKSLQLRAAVSLTSFLREQKEKYDEHEQLQKLYNEFDEGYGTPDLVEAKKLLDETPEA